jgi:hypothetical protein
VATDGPGCDPLFADQAIVDGREVRVFRCDWGWCVKRGEAVGRSRNLVSAFEEALAVRLSPTAMRAVVDLLDRDLTEQHERTGRTAAATVALPADATL